MKRQLIVMTVFATIASAAENGALDLGAITMKAPKDWKAEATTSEMRKAQFVLPRADGDTADATLVIFYFGGGQGGGIQSNLDRYFGFFQQPDGKATKDVAKISKKEISGIAVTFADIGGTYVAAKRPGGAERFNEPGWRMLVAMLQVGDDSYYIRTVGPAKTMKKWEKAFDDFAGSIQKAK